MAKIHCELVVGCPVKHIYLLYKNKNNLIKLDIEVVIILTMYLVPFLIMRKDKTVLKPNRSHSAVSATYKKNGQVSIFGNKFEWEKGHKRPCSITRRAM